MLLVTASPYPAETCVDYSATMRWVGAYSRWAECGDPFGFSDVIHHGGYLYAAHICGSICVLDIQDPAHPTLVSETGMPYGRAHLAARGSHLYAAKAWGLGLYVYEITGDQLTEVGFVDATWPFNGIEIVGHLLYTTNSWGLITYDLSDPADPQLQSSQTLGNRVGGFDVEGDYAYTLDSVNGINSRLLVVSLESSTNPTGVLGTLPLASRANSICVVGPSAYIGSWDGLFFVDVADPNRPRLGGRFNSVGSVYSLTASGNRVVAGHDRVTVIDLKGTTHEEQATRTTMNLPNDGVVFGSCVVGNHVYAAELNDMIAGGYRAGVNAYEVVHEREAPDRAGQVSFAPGCTHAVVAGNDFGCAMDGADLVTFTVGADGEPSALGTVSLAAEPFDWASLERIGNLALVTIAEPEPARLFVADVADPLLPVVRGSVELPGDPSDVAAARGYAFVSCDRESLAVIDLADPDLPAIVATVASPGSRQISLDGNLLATANRDDGVALFDVSSPLVPRLLATLATVRRAIDVYLEGSMLYVADQWHAEVIDVTDPEMPLSLGACELPEENTSIVSWRGRLYLGGRAVKVVDPGGPLGPVFLGASQPYFLSSPCRRGDLAAVTGWLVATSGGQLRVYPPHCDPEPREDANFASPLPESPSMILSAAPNPFNPLTTLHFNLPEPGLARLTVHDAAGRCVRNLQTGKLDAGDHQIEWRGRDDGGRQLSSGVYFCRLKCGGFAATRKVVLLQ